MRVKCNLKAILNEREMSIRELSARTEIGFESLRRLANDVTTQYSKDVLVKVCKELEIGLCDLLILTEDEQA